MQRMTGPGNGNGRLAGQRVVIAEIMDTQGRSHDRLEESGLDLVYGRDVSELADHPMTEDELVRLCNGAKGIIVGSGIRVTDSLLEALPDLHVVSKYGIGTEKIDVEAATRRGVLITNTPVAGNLHSVAEHTIMLMLAALRRLPEMEQHLRRGGWRGPDTVVAALRGKTVGLLGMGRIGRQVAARLSGWETEILGYDPYVNQQEVADLEAEMVELDELLRRSDVISCHMTVTESSMKILNAQTLALTKPTTVIVNTGRGELIDEDALLDALEAGTIGAAALDVFDPEPPSPHNPLLAHPAVIATPHLAGYSQQSLDEIVALATDNLLAALRGEEPPSMKNPEALDAWRARVSSGAS